MIIRINNRKEGIVEYLKTGKRKDSLYIREEKDKVVSITGDLDLADETIKYINTKKKYKDAYQHITISFTWKDFEKFYDPKYDAYDLEKMQQLVDEFMRLYLAGYDKSEYQYYAELHFPKIKYENGKERLPHIHIVLPLLNLISDTKLKPAFFSIKTNDLIQTYLAKKYDLDLPIYHQRPEQEKNIKPLSKEGLKRKELKELLKDIKTEQELLQFFKDNNLLYRKVQTKKNTYYKILNPAGKDINLRGKGMEHLEEIARYGVVKNLPKKKLSIAEKHAQMTLAELEEELREYIKRRVEEIGQRRSKKATAELMKLKEQEQTDNRVQENSISSVKDIKKQFQELLLEQIYNTYIPLQKKGYWVKKEQDKVKIKNYKQGIDIEDRGNKIVAKGKNLKEQVRLMLDIALAKGWKLEEIQVNGSEEFKKEVYRQIRERLKARELQQQEQISLPSKLPFERPKPSPRPTNYTENLHKEKEETKKLDKEYIKEIKENLDPRKVLEYAVKHYKLDPKKYEIIGNKIKNLTNKQKPKNVIDFLQKEVGLSISETFNVVDTLYQEQLKELKKDIKKSNLEEFRMKLSYNTYTRIDYPSENWKVKEIKTKGELETLVRTYPYSPFIFERGHKHSDDVKQMTALILDFDNDNPDYIISMQEVAKRLKEKGIKALLVETKNSWKEKKGIVEERFRVIIPITKEIPISKDDGDAYKRAIKNFARELVGDENYVDPRAMDLARMYRPSPSNAKSLVVVGNPIDFENLLIQAKEQLIREQKEREEQLRKEREQRLKKLENNISVYIYNSEDIQIPITGLTYADVNKIISIPFESLIENFEGIEKKYKEGSYRMIKTDTAKYSILKDGEVIHDFKSGKTYNKISYLYEKLNVNNLMSLARALQNITGEEYIKVNENLVNKAIQEATSKATTLQEFNEIIKDVCNVKFARVDLKTNTIKIADIEVNIDTKTILDKINTNKKAQEQQNKKHNKDWEIDF